MVAAIMWWRLDAVVECLCARRESGISPRAAWQQSNIWREREREGWRKGGVDRGEGEIRDRGKQEAMVTGRDRRKEERCRQKCGATHLRQWLCGDAVLNEWGEQPIAHHHSLQTEAGIIEHPGCLQTSQHPPNQLQSLLLCMPQRSSLTQSVCQQGAFH